MEGEYRQSELGSNLSHNIVDGPVRRTEEFRSLTNRRVNSINAPGEFRINLLRRHQRQIIVRPGVHADLMTLRVLPLRAQIVLYDLTPDLEICRLLVDGAQIIEQGR